MPGVIGGVPGDLSATESRVMRIAVLAVVGSLEVGGAERHLVQVLPRLDAARFQPSVFCLTHRGTLAGEIEAAGVPVLVTDVGGNAEAVVDGETGLVVPALVPARLGEALVRLAGDPARRRAMGAAGRRRVSEHFSLDACVAAYERLYEGLLTAPGRPVQALIDAG